MAELNLDMAVLGEVAHGPNPANKFLETNHVIRIDAHEEIVIKP
jgi:hypothetical protein